MPSMISGVRLRDELGDAVGHDFEFGAETADRLQALDMIPHRLGAVRRLADGLEAAGPGVLRRDETEWATTGTALSQSAFCISSDAAQ